MADILGKAILEISGDTREIKETLEELKRKMNETAESAKGIGEGVDLAVFKEFGKIAAESFMEVTKGIIELGERGAKVNDVSEAFGELSEKAHSTGEEMLGALRAGTQGTVNDFDLMKMSAAALGAGLIKSKADMATLSNGALMLAKRTGGDTREAFETLTKAIETGRTSHLKQLGLFIDTKAATQAYAASIGKTAKELTDHEKATAVSSATMAELRRQFVDKAPVDFGMAVEQLVAGVQNFRDQVAGAVAQSPMLMAGLRAIAPAFSQAFGGNTQSMVKTAVGLVEQFARFLVTLARVAVEGANQMINIWTLLKVTFNGLMFLIVGAIELNMRVLQAFIDLGAKMPGALGAPFRAVQQSVRDITNEVQGARKSFAAQTGEALTAAAAQKAALSVVDGALVKVGLAMDRATVATVAAKKAHKEFGDTTTQVSNLAIINAKKIAEEELRLRSELEMAGRVGLDRRLQEIENEKQKELLKAKELTGGVGQKYAEMTALIASKYQQQAEAARAGSDEIRDKTLQLQQQLTAANLTGLQARLAQIENERQKELQGLANLKTRYGADYAALSAMVKQKYDQMSAAAQGHGLTVAQAAEKAGFKSREELQRTAAIAMDTYQRMRESGEYNADQLRDAFIAAENAKREAAGDSNKFKKALDTDYMDAFSSTMGKLGEKSKAAALAGAVVDLAKAELMTFRTYGWPAALPFMAMLAAAGAAQISKIASAKTGFKAGTPGLDFADFGSMSPVELHGQEAVVPRGRGHLLAAEIAAALPGHGNDEMLAQLAGIRALLEAQPRAFKRVFRDAFPVPAR